MYESISEHDDVERLCLWMSLHYDLEMRQRYRRQRMLQNVEYSDEHLTELVMFTER